MRSIPADEVYHRISVLISIAAGGLEEDSGINNLEHRALSRFHTRWLDGAVLTHYSPQDTAIALLHHVSTAISEMSDYINIQTGGRKSAIETKDHTTEKSTGKPAKVNKKAHPDRN